jgi:hypothetical protein
MTLRSIPSFRSFVLFAFLLVFGTHGCALLTLGGQDSRPPEANYIVVHKEGYPADHNGEGLSRAEYQSHYLEPILGGIDEHAKESCGKNGKEEPLRVLIYVHGGINPYQDGLARVNKWLTVKNENHKKFGLLFGTCYYPIFINWNSSLISSWADELFVIRRGEESPSWMSWFNFVSAPFVLAARVGEGLGSGPPRWLHMAKDNWDGFTRSPYDEADKDEEIVKKVLLGTSFFTFLPMRVAVTWPIIKAAGAPAWEMMKRRASFVVAQRLHKNKYSKRGAARTLMEALMGRVISENGKAMWKIGNSEEAKVDIEITLVGHSMGTLILDRILRGFPKLEFRRIIYMASASSIEDYYSSVLPYLEQHPYPRSEFWAFTLSRSDEARDMNLKPIDFIDTGSLLVYIDNFFENVITPMQLRFGRYTNIEESMTLNNESCNKHNTIHICKLDGSEGEPTDHGGFGEAEKFENTILRKVDPDAFR